MTIMFVLTVGFVAVLQVPGLTGPDVQELNHEFVQRRPCKKAHPIPFA